MFAAIASTKTVRPGRFAQRELGRTLQTRRLNVRLAPPSAETEEGTFAGYGSVFGAVDSYGTVILPGAFKDSLAAHAAAGTSPKCLWQHDPAFPIGAWTSLSEDATGLYCHGKLILEVEKAREAQALLKAGAIDGLSIGFEFDPDDMTEVLPEEAADYGVDAASGCTLENGRIGLIARVDLWEISLVTFQSCAPATVDAVRTIAQPRPNLAPLQAALAARQRALALLSA